MIVYDFDDTILKGDSSSNFYLYCFFKRPILVIIALIKTIPTGLLYLFKKREYKDVIESIFSFLPKLNNVDKMVEDFWNKNEYRVKKWYLDKQTKNDLVISATFTFIIEPICKRLNIKNYIGTDYDLETGKVIGLSSKRANKIIKFEEKYPDKKILKAYSDSPTDIPLLEYAEKGYVVIGNKEILYYEGIFSDVRYTNHPIYEILNSVLTGIILYVYVLILNASMNYLSAFVISFTLTTVLGYYIGKRIVTFTNEDVSNLIKYFLYNIPAFIIMLYILIISPNLNIIYLMLKLLIIYIPNIYLINKIIFEKE